MYRKISIRVKSVRAQDRSAGVAAKRSEATPARAGRGIGDDHETADEQRGRVGGDAMSVFPDDRRALDRIVRGADARAS